jgi:hypothetical protein
MDDVKLQLRQTDSFIVGHRWYLLNMHTKVIEAAGFTTPDEAVDWALNLRYDVEDTEGRVFLS